jgi:hypothetical protein
MKMSYHITEKQRKMYEFLSERSKDRRSFTPRQIAKISGYTTNTVETYFRKYLINLFYIVPDGYVVSNDFIKEIPNEEKYLARVSQTHPSLRRQH